MRALARFGKTSPLIHNRWVGLFAASILALAGVSSGWAQPVTPVPATNSSAVSDAAHTNLAEAERLEKIAEQHTKDGKHEAALPLRVKALDTLENVFGVDHSEIVRSIHLLAETYRQLGQIDKNLPLELRALAIREKNLGPNHSDTAYSIVSLALTYSWLAQYDNKRLVKIQPN